MNYQLLKTFSRLPIQFGRSIARLLAGLVNTLKITKTSKSIELNLRIALPHLTPQQRIAITEKAVRNELTSYFEFLSIWGSSNEENIARIHRIEGEQYFHDALAAKRCCAHCSSFWHMGSHECMVCSVHSNDYFI